MQEKWIGKSYGCNIDFKIKDSFETIKVFSTMPETIFGGTFVAISFEHPLAAKLVKTNAELASFIDDCLIGSVAEAVIRGATVPVLGQMDV